MPPRADLQRDCEDLECTGPGKSQWVSQQLHHS
jgi:hypothetical protein